MRKSIKFSKVTMKIKGPGIFMSIYGHSHGLDGSLFNMFSVYHDVPTRSNGYKLFKKFCHLNVIKYSFSQWVVNDWNSLLTEVVQVLDYEI